MHRVVLRKSICDKFAIIPRAAGRNPISFLTNPNDENQDELEVVGEDKCCSFGVR